jgi:hypothetical protein
MQRKRWIYQNHYRSGTRVLAGSQVMSDGNVAVEDVQADASAPNAEDSRTLHLRQWPWASGTRRGSEITLNSQPCVCTVVPWSWLSAYQWISYHLTSRSPSTPSCSPSLRFLRSSQGPWNLDVAEDMGDAQRLFIGNAERWNLHDRGKNHSVAILIIKLQLSQPKYTKYLLFLNMLMKTCISIYHFADFVWTPTHRFRTWAADHICALKKVLGTRP